MIPCEAEKLLLRESLVPLRHNEELIEALFDTNENDPCCLKDCGLSTKSCCMRITVHISKQLYSMGCKY